MLVFTIASLVLIAPPGQDMIVVMCPGIGLLRTRRSSLPIGKHAARTLGRRIVDGALSDPSRPKIAIVCFAFLPQLVSPEAGQPTLTVFVLGLAFSMSDIPGQGTEPIGSTQ
jgi:threonine/homoserine/homoserine lactone efflux protein